MFLDLDDEKLKLLVDLVDSRIRELHPTIRRSRVSSCTEELKRDLVVLEDVLKQLTSTPADPTLT